tara:strand:- start:373 stop:1074 length:702 start_codon:yes stop_codon:yes gene_type:complete
VKNNKNNINYLIVYSKSWNDELIKKFTINNANFFFCKDKLKLNNYIKKINPKKIFFIHWSFKVSKNITSKLECINFHMTDLPYGRGGSPLQNLILKGFKNTKLSAHRMTDKIDAGDIYLKKNLSLKGSAKSIYVRSTKLSLQMIVHIINNKIYPKKQKGKAVYFKRRNPKQSKLNFREDLELIYNKIRMLDAPGYPKAVTIINSKKIIFTNSKYDGKRLTASVEIVLNEKNKN